MSGLQRLILKKEEEIRAADCCRVQLQLPGKQDKSVGLSGGGQLARSSVPTCPSLRFGNRILQAGPGTGFHALEPTCGVNSLPFSLQVRPADFLHCRVQHLHSRHQGVLDQQPADGQARPG